MTEKKPATPRKTTGRPASSASKSPEVATSDLADAVSGMGVASSADVAQPVSLEEPVAVGAEYVAAASGPSVPEPAHSPTSAPTEADYGYDYAAQQVPVDIGPRKVRLALSRVDPLSIMKLSLLLSFALGIIMVVATAVLWHVLDGMHVFTKINDMILDVTGEGSTVNILDYFEFSKVMSYVTLIAIVDLFILTALATLGAFLYNVTASLVGGVYVTLIDE